MFRRPVLALALSASAVLASFTACYGGDADDAGGAGDGSNGQPLVCPAEPAPASTNKGETFSRTSGECGTDLDGITEPGGSCGVQSTCKPVCCACPNGGSYAAAVCSDGVCLAPCDACNSADLLSVCGSVPEYKVCFGCPDTMEPPELVADGLDFPSEIALTDDAVLVASEGGVLRFAKADGSMTVIFPESVDQIATDGSYVYLENRGLQKVPIFGGPAEPFNTPTYLDDIAVSDGYVYFISGLTDTIQRAPTSGGEPEVVVTREGGPTVLEVTNGFVYWAEDTADDGVFRIPVGGGEVEVLVADHGIDSFVVGSDALYYIATAGVTRAPFGGEPQLLDHTRQSPNQLALDGEWLYLTASELYALKWAKPYTAQITDRYGARDVAVDASHVYWTESEALWRAKK